MALEIEGYDVSQAANGVKLISSLHVHRPDILLLDVNMSWIDGFELCRAVRRNEQLPHAAGALRLRAEGPGGRGGRAGLRRGRLLHQAHRPRRAPRTDARAGRAAVGRAAAMSGFQLEAWLQARGARVEALLADRLRRLEAAPRRLVEAMEYSLLAGGKRLRPAALPRLRRGGAGAAPPGSRGGGRGLRARVRPHLQPGARRPAGDGRRRPPPRPAHQPQGLRRGDGHPRRRRAAHRGLHPARHRARAAAGGAGVAARAGRRRGGHGRRPGAGHRRGPPGRGGVPDPASPGEDRRAAPGGVHPGRRRRGGARPTRWPRPSATATRWGSRSRSPTTCST